MKNTRRHSNREWLIIVLGLLLWMIWLTFQLSDGGLAISAHIGSRTHRTSEVSGVCTKVEISTRATRLARYTRSRKMVYDFHLDNGETFRICCASVQSDSIAEEELQALKGTYITAEYYTTRFLHLHGDTYPLISIRNSAGTVISDEITGKYLARSWNAMRFWLILLGGLAIAITLFNVFAPIIKKHRKNARIRRKKERRKKQLDEKKQNALNIAQGSENVTDAASRASGFLHLLLDK